MDQGRDPCPYRILDDIGGAFAMGAGGGTVWYMGKGWRNSPRGERMRGMITAAKARAPVLGGNFAVWGGLFSTFDCTIAAIRKKEDPFNAILSGAITGALLAARGGRRSIIRNFLVGGFLLSLIEGAQIVISNRLAASHQAADFGMTAVPPPITIQLGGTGDAHLADANSQALDTSKVSAEAVSGWRN